MQYSSNSSYTQNKSLPIGYRPSINIYGSCMMHLTTQVRFLAGRPSPSSFVPARLPLVRSSVVRPPLPLSQSPFFIKTSNYELFMATSALSSSETKSAINHLSFDVWSGSGRALSGLTTTLSSWPTRSVAVGLASLFQQYRNRECLLSNIVTRCLLCL